MHTAVRCPASRGVAHDRSIGPVSFARMAVPPIPMSTGYPAAPHRSFPRSAQLPPGRAPFSDLDCGDLGFGPRVVFDVGLTRALLVDTLPLEHAKTCMGGEVDAVSDVAEKLLEHCESGEFHVGRTRAP